MRGTRARSAVPPTQSLVATVDEGTSADTEAAIDAASVRIRQRTMASTTAAERGALLDRVADALERHRDEFARAEALDTGKRMVEAEYDIDDVTSVFRYYAKLATEDDSRTVNVDRSDVLSRVVHEPVGVCGLITPWNYPLLQTSWKVAPALAAGNTFVLKPSELTPSTAILLMRELDAAGLPAGAGKPGTRHGTERWCAAVDAPICRPGVVYGRPDHGTRHHDVCR